MGVHHEPKTEMHFSSSCLSPIAALLKGGIIVSGEVQLTTHRQFWKIILSPVKRQAAEPFRDYIGLFLGFRGGKGES